MSSVVVSSGHEFETSFCSSGQGCEVLVNVVCSEEGKPLEEI